MPSPAPGLPKQTLITIGGVDVTGFVSGATGRMSDGKEIGRLRIALVRNAQSVLGIIDDSLTGTTVVYSRGINSASEDVKFRGEVVNVKSFGPGGWIIDCRDRMWRAAKHIFSNDYVATDQFAGDPALIWKDHMVRSGVPVDDDYVQAVPDGAVLSRYPVDDERAFRSAERIASELQYRQYYDPNLDTARFEPLTFEDTGFTLVVGENITNRPEWDLLGDELVQRIIVRGAADNVLTEETIPIPGGGVRVFKLQEIPFTTRVFVDGTEQVHGVQGVDDEEDYDYYVDPLEQTIVFLEAPVGTNVEVTYTYLTERPVIASQPSSIARYSTDDDGTEYPYMDVFHMPDITTVDDARRVADSVLGEQGEIEPGAPLRVRGVANLRPNQGIGVVDAESGIDIRTYISELEYQYPYQADIVIVRRRPVSDTDMLYNAHTRLKRLEEQLSKGRKVAVIVFGTSQVVPVRRRVFTRERRAIAGGINGFILDHKEFGVLDSNSLDAETQDDAFTAWEVAWRVPENNVFSDYLVDTEYLDGSASTGTIDTSARTVSLDNTETLVSRLLVKGRTYTSVRINVVSEDAESLTAQVSEDSSFTSPQTIPLGVDTTLTIDTAEGLYLRLTSSADGVVITNNESVFLETLGPGLRLTFQ